MALTTGRIRLLQFFVGAVVVGIAAYQIDPPFYTTWWFFVVGSVFRDAVSGLRKFQALCVGPIFNTETPVIVDLLNPEEIEGDGDED